MIQIDVVLVGALVAMIATAGGLIVKITNLIRYIEGRIDSLKAEQRLQRHQIDSSLILLDYRVRDLEKHAELHAGFAPHHRREEGRTGSPFLDDPP